MNTTALLLAVAAAARLYAWPSPDARVPIPESRVPGHESRTPNPEFRVPSPESRAQTSSSQRHDRLFPPQDLGLLEGPDRAEWQRPDQIMDALNIADGSKVADIGAGAGWFTIELARRVGPRGTVYARDVQPEMVTAITRRVSREGLRNVNAQLGSTNLPERSLDAILIVDTYQEVPEEERVAFLRDVARALKPTGRIGIVNYKPGRGGPGPEPERRVERAVVESGAQSAGLQILARENLRYQYMIVLGR